MDTKQKKAKELYLCLRGKRKLLVLYTPFGKYKIPLSGISKLRKNRLFFLYFDPFIPEKEYRKQEALNEETKKRLNEDLRLTEAKRLITEGVQ